MAKQTLASLNIVTDEMASVASVRPNKYNPNRQSDDEFLLLVKSIVEDGFTDAIIINKETREIIDGEHRWTAAIVLHELLKQGQPVTLATTTALRAKRDEIIDKNLMIPVKVLDKDEIQRRISTQRHNKARGTDDMELAAQMFRELEAMGGLKDAVAGLDMSNEEVERLLSYGDSILDHFPGEEPSLAWEPRFTQPGMVKDYQSDDGMDLQSVSRVASTPIAPAGSAVPLSSIPGMVSNPLSDIRPEIAPVRMARRVYVMIESEAKIVDQALGDEAATTLIAMCKQKLGME